MDERKEGSTRIPAERTRDGLTLVEVQPGGVRLLPLAASSGEAEPGIRVLPVEEAGVIRVLEIRCACGRELTIQCE